jgi:coproporphyrinogen III oxidase-like Fe-S oxidoreductase
VEEDLTFATRYCKRQKTIFLADGDALVIPHNKMVRILEGIKSNIPWVRRVSLYANCRDILARSMEQLVELKTLGLGRIYMGLESGHGPTLLTINKGAEPEDMIQAGKRVRKAGIFLSVSCLLGVAGKALSIPHATATAEVLNAMQPSQIAVLTLMVLENTEMGSLEQTGIFTLPDRQQLFTELRTLVAGLSDIRTQFQANHASNYFTLNGRLPRDKAQFLTIIDQALSGKLYLKSEGVRAL